MKKKNESKLVPEFPKKIFPGRLYKKINIAAKIKNKYKELGFLINRTKVKNNY